MEDARSIFLIFSLFSHKTAYSDSDEHQLKLRQAKIAILPLLKQQRHSARFPDGHALCF